jgi:hypothetical protein
MRQEHKAGEKLFVDYAGQTVPVEAACRRALALGAPSLKTIRSILQHNLDRQALPEPATSAAPASLLEHPNLRGAHYYTGSSSRVIRCARAEGS